MIRLRTLALITVATAILLIVQTLGAAPPPAAQIPAVVEFTLAGGAIADDGGGPYTDGVVECVNAWFDPRKGNSFFRTVSFNNCGAAPAIRKVTLDFSNPFGEPVNCDDTTGGACLIEGDGQFAIEPPLDAKGVNVLTDVRILTGTLFTRSTTSVTLNFDLGENYVQAGGQDVQFSLAFLSNLPVANPGDSSRVVSSDGTVLARLSRRSGRKYVKVGDYSMPFAMSMIAQ
jgi:hypothetical protein